MSNQAMGTIPNLDSNDRIAELQVAIPKIEAELANAKKLEALSESKEFQESIIDTLLGTEAEALAVGLLDTFISVEREQEILFELKALRYLKLLLARKANETEKLQARLAENKQLLLERMSSGEEM